MRDINGKRNILINAALCLCAFILAAAVAEYALSKINIEGLSGYKLYVGKVDSVIYFSKHSRYIDRDGKGKGFDMGNCYPSNPNGLLQYKAINPYDGKYCYCVLYNAEQRRRGFHPERKRQIAIAGDSFVYGNGVRNEDTLGYFLNEQYPEINFQNWGKKGADIDDVASICKTNSLSAPPVEEVIYFLNLNDMRLSEQIRLRQKDIINDFQNVRWDYDKQKYHPPFRFLAQSAIFSTARKVWMINRESSRTIQNYRDMYLSENNRRELISTMDEIRSIQDTLAARGISFRVVIYPLIYKDILGRYPFGQIHEVIMNECRKRGVACLDGYAPFKSHYSMKKFAVHPLDYHPNGLSNHLLADYLRETNFITEKKSRQSH